VATPKKVRKRTPESYARPLEMTLEDQRQVHNWLMSRYRANRKNAGPDGNVAELYDQLLMKQINDSARTIAHLGKELREFERGLRMSQLTEEDVAALLERSWSQVARHVSNINLITEAQRRGFISKEQLREIVDRELAEARRATGGRVPPATTERGTEVS